ncbi:TonB-dependent receptor [Sphingomonas gei]|uniref:TonB-dependent receptor n=1 Tax=Sphingomonas gei TaxID=1395960 RepID=A0A4V3QZG3_9SPHN|nr:TonB-dependent receptor [Sphingomonas gei]TGX54142.1 TonB-dependent receptor [Sphingomonas gei]
MKKGLSGVIVGLLTSTALVGPAWAQDAVAPAVQQNPEGGEAQGEEILVTGIRASQEAAVDIKRNEVAIVDAISAEDIGKLPDVTIVDALQRISGVQIQRNAGEGTNVNIRGLPQVITLLNGEQYLSPGNLGEARPNLNDLPAQLMNQVLVFKSTDTRNALSGISGTVDLRTRRPFDLDKGLTLSGQAEYSRGDYTKENDYLVSGLIAWRNENFGAMLSAVKSNSNLGNNYAGIAGGPFGNNDWGGSGPNWISPHGYEFFNRVVERDRLGINGAVQLKFGEGFTLSGEVFHTEFTEHNRAAGINISNRWSGLGWTNPTASSDSGQVAGNGQPWLDVDEYDLNVWWLNSFTVNRTTKSKATNYNLQLDYDNESNFKFSARAMRADANFRSINGQVQGDMSNWRQTNTFTLFRDANDPTRGPFYPANIAAQFPASRYTNGVVGSNGGRYIDPNPLGYGQNPQIHLDIGGDHPVLSGFQNPISGGLGTRPLSEYMANLDSYAVGAFSSEGNQENNSDLGVFRADGSYEFDDDGLFGAFKRIDVGVRRSDRSVQIRAFHLFSNFYGGNGATVAEGCGAQWKAIDVVMNQAGCQAGEQVANPAFNPGLPVSATNPTTVFQGYTVNKPTKLNEYNNVYFLTNLGGVSSGIPGFWVADPRDFDDAKAFHERVFGGADEVIIPGRTYDVDLVEESAYLNTSFKTGIFSAAIGGKIINTKLTVKQNITGPTRSYGDTNTDEGDTVTRRDYVDFLPAVNLSADITQNLRLRASFAKTMLPLDLGNYGGGLTISTADSLCPKPGDPPPPADAAPCGVRQVTGANSSGNPYLNPWRSNNYDLAIEYYLGRGTLFNVSLFKLDINSFVRTTTTNTGRFPDQDGVIRRTVPVTQPAQGEGGSLQGVEVGAKIAFSDLIQGGLLSNFGIDANYTFSDSKQTDKGLDGEELPFPDNSKHQVNLVGWYQDDALQVRVAYNYRTPRLSTTFGAIPIFQDTAQYVDANITYNINDNFALYANASNIFGEIERYYFQFDKDSKQFHSQNEFEPRYSAGVRVRF